MRMILLWPELFKADKHSSKESGGMARYWEGITPSRGRSNQILFALLDQENKG